GRAPGRPLLVGSAKANVGHLGAAAGAVGLLKVVLAARHGILPPHLVDTPSTRIDWDRVPVALVREAQPWPERDRPARAGVSAFGFSGSNAHVLVEGYPAQRREAVPRPAPAGERVLLVSAATPGALAAVALRVAERLDATPERLDDLLYTTTHRRAWLEHRLAVVGTDAQSLAAALEEASFGDAGPSVRHGCVERGARATVALRFGPELPDRETRERWAGAAPAYREAMEEHARLLGGLGVLPADLDDTPPGPQRDAWTFCHQAAATAALRTLGVAQADAVGEGVGAVSAAWASGRLSTIEALRRCLEPEPAAAGLPQASDSWCDITLDVLRRDTTPALVAAEAFVTGYRPTPPAVPTGRLVELPAYPWEHQDYWYRDFPTPRATTWTLSADTATELRARAQELAAFVRESQADPVGVGWALLDRPAARHRAALVGADRDALLTALDHLAARGADTDGAAAGRPRVALVFPGQGWQWAGMARELLAVVPAFTEVIDRVSAAVEDLAGWSVRDALTGAPGAADLGRVDVLQPAMFAVMVGLARVWESLGVVPDAVVGHSQGEIAAACVAGVLSVEDATRIVVVRSAVIAEIAGAGTMLSVSSPAAVVESALSAWPDRLWLAAVNGPSSVVVAGETAAALEFLAAGQEQGLRIRRIPVDYASHSPQVKAVRERILTGLVGLTPVTGRLPVYSSVTGRRIDGAAMDAAYWYRNLREPVRFQDATQALLRDDVRVFVEASAHPVLTLGLEDTAGQEGTAVTVTGTLRRDDGGPARLQTSAGALWTAGVILDWRALLPASDIVPRLPSGPVAQAPADQPATADQERFWRVVEHGDAGEFAELLGPVGADEQARLRDALPVLSQWWRGRREQAVVRDWRYQVAWQPLGPRPRPELAGTWLVLTPDRLADDERTARCLRAIDDHGGRAVLVTVADEAENLAAALAARVESSTAGILSLLALDETPHSDHPALPTGLATTLHLLQQHPQHAATPLHIVTTAAAATHPDDPLTHPTQAHLWGLTRTQLVENPYLPLSHLDLPAVWDTTTAAQLATALTDRSPALALRPTGSYAPVLAPAPLTDTLAPAPLDPDGTVLITGGTGALGSHIARHHARRHHHLHLLSRQGPHHPNATHLRTELLALGAPTVTLTACDTADRTALATALATIPPDHPLTAVIHTAGIADDRPLGAVTTADLERALRPKAQSVRNLHELTLEDDLAAFVLYSSFSTLMPHVGQGAYAAANSYLDAFAQHRRSLGLPAASIAWGAWAGGGMAERESFQEWIARGGMDLITPHLGVVALQQALDQGDTALAIAAIDWSRVAERSVGTRPDPLLSELIGTVDTAAGRAGAAGPIAAERLAALPAAQRDQQVLTLVCAELATVLGHSRARAIDDSRGFKDLGIDSVTAIELRNRIGAATGIRFSPIAVFDYPNPTALARHLSGLVRASDQDGTTPAGADHHGEVSSRIDLLAVEDLVRMARQENPA
ncbi:SDR family NAD(P)-dependent oxidoreductase, partial [Frankia sp. AiPs1]|uniref:SDR family NAD(P)-dependent oxidoreductase n=1 Tax=Frankia sp. AiPs1 TaxID=573493 RepID=UPI002042F2DF